MSELQQPKFRPSRTRPFVVAALAVIAAGSFVSPTPARQKSPAVATPAGPAFTHRGQRTANDIKYGDWQKLCFKAAGAKTVCRTTISGTFETGQVAVRLDLIEREGDRTARLQSFVPVGMYLQVPIKLSIDGGKSYPLRYNWCLTNACVAADVADPRIVAEMESGKTLALEVVDHNLLSLTTSLPLAQFASVHKGPPAQTLEQDIDE